jgi:hypothetical protein
MVSIDVPNTHAMRDPAFAESEIRKHFGEWIAVGESVLTYGSNLLLRSMRTSQDSIEDLVLLGSAFRQVLVAADGCLVCLRAGAVQSAMLHSRAEFEASMAVEWMLTKGKKHWARQYYVSSLRQMRVWSLQMIPGTSEHEAHVAAWASIDEPPHISDDNIKVASDEIAEIEALLSSPTYKEINEAFDKQSIAGRGSKRRPVEPNWYAPGGVPTIAAMARALGRTAEYSSTYRYQSYFVHGSLSDNHFTVKGKSASIEPVRYLKQFAMAFNLTFLDLVKVIEHITTEYRSGELAELREKYRTEWRSALNNFAKVTVNPTSLDF